MDTHWGNRGSHSGVYGDSSLTTRVFETG